MVEPIAIIGSGCRFPGGADTPSKLWSVISDPQDLSRKPAATRFNVDSFYHPVGTHHGTTNATKSYWLEDEGRTDVAKFDTGFFSIQATEADATDPQQRVLMEVVYDSLCAAGQPMEKLRGSDTAVYVGSMCDDYNTMLTRDYETLPRYAATGLQRGILSSRVSYFFDWHGPSASVDTACSSSLVALDHAVQTIRSGRSKMAVAAGTSLILSPAMYISESNLGMLSPSGRCAMWDVAADGYARGEGVAAVVLKSLSQALADGDPIECIIRESGVNQDGRTPGLTMPSGFAQAALIQECYARAGLDPINNPQDRPQFFQAHGTGTQAGDPQESSAIANALFPAGSRAALSKEKLLVGSIKTVIGHTEGAAGLASVIATAQALKHGIVPPNLHFHNLNPKVEPYYKHLTVPTSAQPWPVAEGQVRRASVNSFGFGGTNAHCILEAPPSAIAGARTSTPLYTPLTFSAASATALKATLSSHLEFFKSNPDVEIADLAYTLQHRRSTLHYRKAVAATDAESAIKSLEAILESDDSSLNTRFNTSQSSKILGVFTGQGAQWPRMGAELVESSDFAAARLAELDAALQTLPIESDRPSWTLRDQLCAAKETSRIAEAALSQPLCTAAQVILVDLLHEAGISFSAVVGHSSGEIGAAYAAGLLSAKDAIRVAYFRGVHAKLASGPAPRAARGAMMAIGASFEEARDICQRSAFVGRLQVAAVNSSSSVTISGDEDAVDEAEAALKSQGVFARKLKVDTAYHSAHMIPCAGPYLESLASCGIQPIRPSENNKTTWYSSVYEGTPMTMDKLTNQYWADNMCNTVWFAGALDHALQANSVFDLVTEVGPHPALQGPAMATIESVYGGKTIPYTGVLSRGKSDIKHFSEALGFIWTQLGFGSVQFSAVQTLLSGSEHTTVLGDLPPYPFDHQRPYWINGRLPNHHRNRSLLHVTNPVLGNPCAEANTTGEYQWRKMLQPSEMSWLKGHMLQGQIVFPATGYVSMAVEAIKAIALEAVPDTEVSLLRLQNIDIPKALAFDDETTRIEIIFSVSSVSVTKGAIAATWACYSVTDGPMNAVLNAAGQVHCSLSPAKPDTLPVVKADAYSLASVDDDRFYGNLSKIGYNYSAPFRGLSNIRRKMGYSAGDLADQSESDWDNKLILHPGMLDSALQAIFAAWSFPGDNLIWSLHVPVSISAVTVNPYFTQLSGGGKQSSLHYESFVRSMEPSEVVGDIYVHTNNGDNAFLQIEGVALVPFARATPKNDLPMFSQYQYKVASPDGKLAAAGETLTNSEVQMYRDVDRVAYWFARNAAQLISGSERLDLLPHYQRYLDWCDRMVDVVSRNAHPRVKAEFNADTRADITRVLAPYEGRKDIKLVEVVGDNLIPVIRAGTSMLEHMNQDGLLQAFYEEEALCCGPNGRWLARIVSQITHRFPNVNILEVGAGTGATTSAILKEIGDTYSSYTYTDISSGPFMDAEERFAQSASRMVFKTFDMEKTPSSQGYVEGLYDVVVASNVLHVSEDVEHALSNVRRLLKPGGYLIIGEPTSTDLLFTGMTVGTLPGYWVGAESGRPDGPMFTLFQWDAALKKAGFAGIDTATPDISASFPVSAFVAQAVNDQVMFLRAPLDVNERPAGIRNDGLAIIGGTTTSTHKLGQDVANVLSHRFSNKQFFDSMEDFAASDLANRPSQEGPVTVVSLVDLDKPYLERLTPAKFAALKTLWAIAGTMVWVTCGSRKNKPYSYMMKGVLDTVKTEYPNLSIQMYDLEYTSGNRSGIEAGTATDLAVTLLREHCMHEWGMDAGMLWTSEPEMYVSGGSQLITRLVPDVEKNNRWNSRRRDVLAEVSPAQETVELAATGQGSDRSLELRKASPLRITNSMTFGYRSIRVTHSLLQSLAVDGAGFLRLCTGIDEDTNEAVLALTSSYESLANVPKQWSIVLSESLDSSALFAIGANLIAERVLSLAAQGSTLLVHDSDAAIKDALQIKAKSKDVRTFFTTSSLEQSEDGTSIYLHPNSPRHVMQYAIPSSVALFVQFSQGASSDAVGHVIANCLPSTSRKLTETDIVSHEVVPLANAEATKPLAQALQKALDDSHQTSTLNRPHISLTDATLRSGVGEPLTVVDWTACKTVTAKIEPIDSGKLFSANKTYLFVGMAGELGESLAKWMVEHGARTVVLTSRNPKVNPRFIKDMERQHGATVQTMSLDVTSRESVENVLHAIRATLPVIGGVVNGAMILEDQLFAEMTLERFNRVTAPKVIGTQLLDQAFKNDTSLEFFIVTSSIATILGWTGQSNYSAANEFMTAVIFNRRARGLAGSTMNIPAVLGTGVAARTDFDFDYFESIGHLNIGESDLHTLFAEAVLSGRAGQGPEVPSQVGMGVNFIPADLEVKDSHKRGVKFSHFIQNDGKGVEDTSANKSNVRVKVQLQAATSAEEGYDITRDAFLAYLQRLFRLGEEDSFDDSSSLVDQGVDSLVAVDIRSWFLKELGIDMPTLKILGGGSIADLVKTAVEKMPELAGGIATPEESSGASTPSGGHRSPVPELIPGSDSKGPSGLSSAYRSPLLTQAHTPNDSNSPILSPKEIVNKLAEVREVEVLESDDHVRAA